MPDLPGTQVVAAIDLFGICCMLAVATSPNVQLRQGCQTLSRSLMAVENCRLPDLPGPVMLAIVFLHPAARPDMQRIQ